MSAYWKRRALALVLFVFLLAGCASAPPAPSVAPPTSSQDFRVSNEHLASISKAFQSFKGSMLAKIADVDKKSLVFGSDVSNQWLQEKEEAKKLLKKGDGWAKEAEDKVQNGKATNKDVAHYRTLISILMDQPEFEKVVKRYRSLGGI